MAAADVAVGVAIGLAVGAPAARLGRSWARELAAATPDGSSFGPPGGPSRGPSRVTSHERAATAVAVLGACAWGGALAALDEAGVALRTGLAVLGACLVVHVVTDALAHRVVRVVSHVALASAVACGAAVAARGDTAPLARGGATAAGALVLAFATAMLSRGGLAAGDVRLLPAIGWHLGALDASAPIVWLVAASAAGAAHAVWLVAVRGAGRRARLAFAPALALGALVAILRVAVVG